MSLADDDLEFLQSQLEGLESIFLELIPFGVELKRQQVQAYYSKRFYDAIHPAPNVAENELRRQFNSRADSVCNLMDKAESLGLASDKLNLIRAAASLHAQRKILVGSKFQKFCRQILTNHSADPVVLSDILSGELLSPVEARVLLGSLMFMIVEELDQEGKPLSVETLLSMIIERIRDTKVLAANDPFLVEAQCVLDASKEETVSNSDHK